MAVDWSSLTRREVEILDAVRERLTNAEIGARFFISERTVESHVSSLLRKLGVGDRVELAALTPPAAAAQQLRAELPGQVQVHLTEPLTGRRDEFDQLAALWGKAVTGQTLLGVVTGEAGVGKSRLVAELAAGAHRDGARILWSACFEDVQAPYQPLADALEDHAALLTSGTLGEDLAASAPVLARMLGMVSQTETGRLPLAIDPRTGASELSMALRRYLSWLASNGPVLLVVEDLHWAADSTRDALLHLVRSSDPIPLLVLGTARDTPPDVDAGGDVFLGRCELLPNSERLTLHGLDPRGVTDLLASIGSDADAPQVWADTAGNPLLVRELARSRGSRGSSLAALLAPRYRRLRKDAVDVLDAAAVLGASFDATHIGGVLDRPVMEVVHALDEAEAAGLVVSIPDRAGRFAFVHPLFRTLHYRSLPTSERLQLHHHAAVELEQTAADERMLPALARHACIAAPLGDPRAAIRYACDAAAVAERVLALDDAAHHYRQALTVAELLPEDRRLRLQLMITLGQVLSRSGDQSGRAMLAEAASWARELADGAALADIAWAMVRFGMRTGARTDAEFVTIAEDALKLLGEQDTAPRARVLAALSGQLTAGGDPERGKRYVDESLAIARALDDPMTIGVALLAQRRSGGLPLRPEARLKIADELVSLGERLREPVFAIQGLYTRVWSLRELGDLTGHDRALEEHEAKVGDHPFVHARMSVAANRVMQDFLRGDLASAESRLGGVSELAEAAGFEPLLISGPPQFLVMHARGRAGELASAIEERGENQPGFRGSYEARLAVSYAHAGRVEDARRIVQATAADGFASVQPNTDYTTGLCLFAEAAELTGEAEAARKLLDRLDPYSGLIADSSGSIFEPVDLGIAKAALAAADPSRARASAERVLTSEAGRRAPVFRGRALIRLAAAEAAGAGSLEPRDVLVSEALRIAHDTGAFVIEQDAERYGLSPR